MEPHEFFVRDALEITVLHWNQVCGRALSAGRAGDPPRQNLLTLRMEGKSLVPIVAWRGRSDWVDLARPMPAYR